MVAFIHSFIYAFIHPLHNVRAPTAGCAPSPAPSLSAPFPATSRPLAAHGSRLLGLSLASSPTPVLWHWCSLLGMPSPALDRLLPTLQEPDAKAASSVKPSAPLAVLVLSPRLLPSH